MNNEDPYTQSEHDDAVGIGCAGLAAGLILIGVSIWLTILFT